MLSSRQESADLRVELIRYLPWPDQNASPLTRYRQDCPAAAAPVSTTTALRKGSEHSPITARADLVAKRAIPEFISASRIAYPIKPGQRARRGPNTVP